MILSSHIGAFILIQFNCKKYNDYNVYLQFKCQNFVTTIQCLFKKMETFLFTQNLGNDSSKRRSRLLDAGFGWIHHRVAALAPGTLPWENRETFFDPKKWRMKSLSGSYHENVILHVKNQDVFPCFFSSMWKPTCFPMFWDPI